MLRGRRLGLGVVLRGVEGLLLGSRVALRLFENTLGRRLGCRGFIKRLMSLVSLFLSRSNIGRLLCELIAGGGVGGLLVCNGVLCVFEICRACRNSLLCLVA